MALKVLELIPSTYRKVTILALKWRPESIKIIVADKLMVCAWNCIFTLCILVISVTFIACSVKIYTITIKIYHFSHNVITSHMDGNFTCKRWQMLTVKSPFFILMKHGPEHHFYNILQKHGTFCCHRLCFHFSKTFFILWCPNFAYFIFLSSIIYFPSCWSSVAAFVLLCVWQQFYCTAYECC